MHQDDCSGHIWVCKCSTQKRELGFLNQRMREYTHMYHIWGNLRRTLSYTFFYFHSNSLTRCFLLIMHENACSDFVFFKLFVQCRVPESHLCCLFFRVLRHGMHVSCRSYHNLRDGKRGPIDRADFSASQGAALVLLHLISFTFVEYFFVH